MPLARRCTDFSAAASHWLAPLRSRLQVAENGMQLRQGQISVARSLVLLAALLDEAAASRDPARRIGAVSPPPAPAHYSGSMLAILNRLKKRRDEAAASEALAAGVQAAHSAGVQAAEAEKAAQALEVQAVQPAGAQAVQAGADAAFQPLPDAAAAVPPPDDTGHALVPTSTLPGHPLSSLGHEPSEQSTVALPTPALALGIVLTTAEAENGGAHPHPPPSGERGDLTAAAAADGSAPPPPPVGSDPPVTRQGRSWRIMLKRPSQQRMPTSAGASTGNDEGRDLALVPEEVALAPEPPEEAALAPELQELIGQCMRDPILAEQLLNQVEEVRRSTLEGARRGGGDAAAAVAAMVHVAALEDALRHRDVAACVVQLGVMSSSAGL